MDRVQLKGYCHHTVEAALSRVASLSKTEGSVLFCPEDKHTDCEVERPVIAGPAVLPLPRYRNQQNRILVQPSDAAIKSHREAGHDCRGVVPWLSGTTMGVAPKIVYRHDVILYHKFRSGRDLEHARAVLSECGLSDVVAFRYGSYNQRDYLKALATSRFVLWVGCGESQGLALHQAWAHGIPSAVWDIGTFGLSTGTLPPEYRNVSTTAVPYWHRSCGLRVTHKDDVKGMVEQMSKRWSSFKPQTFVEACLSDEVSKMEWDLMVRACKFRLVSKPSEYPKVHVIVPLFNGVELLHRALLSVIGQTYTLWQLTVVLNGVDRESHTALRARELACLDARIEVLHFACGKQQAMREVAEISKCPWLAVLDADDVWMPRKLALQLEFARTHPQADIIGGRVELFGFASGVGCDKFGTRRLRTRHFLGANPMLHSAVIMKRPLATWSDGAAVCDDLELFMRHKYQGRNFFNIPDVVYRKYVDDDHSFYAGRDAPYAARLFRVWSPLLRIASNKKKVYVQLCGGLGNQLFAAATGLAYAKRHGREICFDVRWFSEVHGGDVTARTLSPMFRTMPVTTEVPDDAKTHVVSGHGYTKIPAFAEKSVLLAGTFLSARFFDDSVDLVHNVLEPSVEASSAAHAWIATFPEACSVTCVHVRRGDYLTQPEKYGHTTPSDTFLRSAMAKVKAEDPFTTFVTFSDDPDFVVDGTVQAPDVDGETALCMMRACRNHIMSASTLSWWADWLRMDRGTIIAPATWNSAHGTPDIGLPHWQFIEEESEENGEEETKTESTEGEETTGKKVSPGGSSFSTEGGGTESSS